MCYGRSEGNQSPHIGVFVCVFGLLMHEMFLILWRIYISSSGPDCSLSPVLGTKNPHHFWVQQDEQGALWPHDVLQ